MPFALPSTLSLILLLTLASGLGAQAVRGTVSDPQTGAPIEGAMVVLLGETDPTGVQVLTDAEGRYLLKVPAAGRYRLRADRIGHASTFSEVFEVGERETLIRDLTARVQAIVLEGIDVDAERQCRLRPEEGEATALLWEETRKALAAAAWTQDAGVYRYELEYHDRELDRDARVVMRETTRTEVSVRRRTFSSRPAEDLRDHGYARRNDDGWSYFAPDADVLLSDAFLDTHCFGVRRGSRESAGLIGLTFSPTSGREIDIDGTLWLDPTTARLRWLDFRYRNLPDDLIHDRIGGRVEFLQLPTGPWIVNRFTIRMPQRQEQVIRGSRRITVSGFWEQGATVQRIRDSRGRPIAELESATLAGSVRAVFGTEPLAQAAVFLVGTERETFTDEDGRFRLTGLEEGIYQVSYRHPSVDSVGFVPEPVEVSLELGQVTTVGLEAPSPYASLTERCADEEVPVGWAALLGWVRDGAEDTALPNARVQVRWSRYDVQSSDPAPTARSGRSGGVDASLLITESTSGFEAVADARGFYLLCAVPTGIPLEISASWQDVQQRPIRIRIDRGAFQHVYDVALRIEPRDD